MPLRVYRRPDTGTLYIIGTITPAGQKTGYRIRQRAGSNDEALAREEAAAIEREIIRNHHLGQRPIERGFAAAAQSYVQAEPRARETVRLVTNLLRHFGNAPLRSIGQEAVDTARSVILKPDASPGTVRRNLIVPLRAILNHAAWRGWCDKPQFQLPREPKGRTAFLLPHQFEAMRAAAPERMQPLLTWLICTGCRLGETLALEWSQVDLQAATVRLWPDQTKAGSSRIVHLPPAAVAALASLPHRDGHVFRSRYRGADGEFLPYRQTESGGGGQIKNGLASACRRAGVQEISAHVLRHSWASWYWALHRDLLALRDAGGWSTVTLVERYAHCCPSGQEEAIRRVWGLGLALVEAKVA